MQGGDAVLKQVLAAFEHESHLNLHDRPIHISVNDCTLTVAGEVPDIASICASKVQAPAQHFHAWTRQATGW
ncbi:hypothetical protein [Caballeronia sp. KNU42]